MRVMRLSTKLIMAMVLLATIIVVVSSMAISGGIYFLTERTIKAELIENANIVIREYLSIESDEIVQKARYDQANLAVFLRNIDVSLIIVDDSQKVLARYGIYRDLGSDWSTLPAVSAGKYEDKSIDNYGVFDFYTAPIKFDGKLYGFMQIARKNTEIGLIKKSVQIVMLIMLPVAIVIATLLALLTGRRVVAPMMKLSEKLESADITALPLITQSAQMDHEVLIVTQAINSLIARLRANIIRERQLSENISHEFKTPLTRIASNLQVGKTKEAEEEVIDLGDNVDALLSLAVWEKTNATCDLAKVIPLVVKQLSIAGKVKISLPKKLITPLPSSHAQIILKNILDNASKNMLGETKILIDAKEENNYWEVRITNDTNVNLVDSRKVVQRKFRYGKRAGQGIGMSIVDQMCKLHSIDMKINLQDNQFQVSFRGAKRVAE